LSVFQDILDLDPGERWQKALYHEIDKCDVVSALLVARRGGFRVVGKEIDYALASKEMRNSRPISNRFRSKDRQSCRRPLASAGCTSTMRCSLRSVRPRRRSTTDGYR
jgi:hypothetical protein